MYFVSKSHGVLIVGTIINSIYQFIVAVYFLWSKDDYVSYREIPFKIVFIRHEANRQQFKDYKFIIFSLYIVPS